MKKRHRLGGFGSNGAGRSCDTTDYVVFATLPIAGVAAGYWYSKSQIAAGAPSTESGIPWSVLVGFVTGATLAWISRNGGCRL